MEINQTEVGDSVLEHAITDAVAPAAQSIKNNSAVDSLPKAAAIRAADAKAFTSLARNEFFKNHQNIPTELRNFPAWLVWQCPEINKGKVKKVPVYATNGKKRSGIQGEPNDLANLVTFDQAVNYATSHTNVAGIGFCTLPQFGVTALDVDHCIVNGELRQNVDPLINNTYAELSPSDTGIRAFYRGSARNGKNHAEGYELFSSVGFVTVTGKALFEDEPLPLQVLDEPLRQTLEKLSTKAVKPIRTNPSPPIPHLASPKKSSQPTVRTIIDLGSAIDHLDADGYSDWIKIGLALSSLKGTDHEDSALELFHKVSAKSDKYDTAECDAKWSKDLNADSLTYKSIFHWAKERGWVNPQTEDQPTVIEIESWTGKPVDVYSEQPCPNFPLDVLPQELINYAQGYSDSSGFDVGAFAFTTLFGTMGLIDKRARIKASDTWFQPPIIWAALADSSGGGKSMVISTGAKLLNSINKKIVTDSMRESDSFNKAKAALNNKAQQGELQKPDWHQIVVEDTTTEALADVLKTNPRGVTLIADEMTGFIGNLDAYSGGGGDRDRGIYLSAYDGGSKTINRKGAGYTYVPNFAVSILTGVQPAKLADLYKKSAAGGADGLYQRFLTYNMQPSKLMNINSKLGTFTEINAQALADQIERWTQDNVFLRDPPSLSSEAAKVVEDYCNAMNGIAKRTVNERFREHLFKYKGFLLRIALGLHVIHAAARGEMFGGVVEVENINRAKSLLACLYHHSDSIYNLLDVDNGTTAKTRLVAEFILVKKIDTFSFGDVSRQVEPSRNWIRLEREAVFDRLIEFDWIRDVTPMSSGRRGRPTMGKFIVNPAVHSEFSDTTKRLAIGRGERFDLLQKTIQAKKGVLS